VKELLRNALREDMNVVNDLLFEPNATLCICRLEKSVESLTDFGLIQIFGKSRYNLYACYFTLFILFFLERIGEFNKLLAISFI
jgi:hypothetical protein